MSDIVKHTIDVTPTGVDKVSKVPSIANKVSDSLNAVSYETGCTCRLA